MGTTNQEKWTAILQVSVLFSVLFQLCYDFDTNILLVIVLKTNDLIYNNNLTIGTNISEKSTLLFRVPDNVRKMNFN